MCMQKYRIVCVIALVLMLIMSYLTLTTKVNASASVVAVGDNLIHPVVYNDAKVGSNKYDFKPMYKHVKSNIQQADFAYVNQNHRLVEMISRTQDLNNLIHRVM